LYDGLKSMLVGKKTPAAGAEGDDAIKEGMTLADFASTVKKARMMKDMAAYGGFNGMPGLNTEKLKLIEDVAAAFPNDTSDPNSITEAAKRAAAEKVGCTPADVKMALTSWAMVKKAATQAAKWKEQGKPEPTSMQDLAQMYQQGMQDGFVTRQKAGRNNPCPCGSGVKFKKCCLPRQEELKKLGKW